MNSVCSDDYSMPLATRRSSSSSSDDCDEGGERPTAGPGDEGLQTVPLLKEIRGKLRLDENALENVLDPHKIGNLPIAVIWIAGASRMGKSFILNFFLRYFQKKGWQPSPGSWIEGWTSTEDCGISWKGGAKGDTRGIVALKEPIVVERTNGEQLAVILLDTQGNFEHGCSRELNVGIFALSTLVSSLQIFNVSKQIQTNDIDYLQCFVEFSKSASRISSDVDSGAGDRQKCFFQDLLFLVRDWQYPSDFQYGINGGNTYLETLSCSEVDAQACRYLDRAFSNIQCFLMPEPSRKVRRNQLQHQPLVAKDIWNSFSKSLLDIVDKCIHPDRLKAKTLGFSGRVTARVLLQHVKCCAEKILGGERPEFPSLMKLVALNANRVALEKVEKQYVAEVEKAIKCMEVPSWPEFDRLLALEEKKARKLFLDRTSFGREELEPSDSECFEHRVSRALPGLNGLMRQKRCSLIQQKIQLWMDESIERLKVRTFPYTDIKELGKIRDKRKSLLPVKDDRDPDSVTMQLEGAKDSPNASYDENVRDAKVSNGMVTVEVAGSALLGAAVADPIVIACFFIGEAWLEALLRGPSELAVRR